MKMKVKLVFGLGFLFTMIFTLIIFCSYYIEKLAADSNNILKNNYKSLEFAKNMLSTLDDMNHFLIKDLLIGSNQDSIQNISKNVKYYENNFEKYLNLEENNITEISEKEFVDTLKLNYNQYFKLISDKILNIKDKKNLEEYSALYNSYKSVKNSIDNIYQVNVEAINRKNHIAMVDSDDFIRNMTIFGVFCLILSLGYFWYFPFYISNSLNILSEKSKKLLNDLNISNNTNSKDEFETIQNNFNLIEKEIKQTKL
jgi:two-component system, NtrC family, sensor histidine kinase KinB